MPNYANTCSQLVRSVAIFNQTDPERELIPVLDFTTYERARHSADIHFNIFRVYGKGKSEGTEERVNDHFGPMIKGSSTRTKVSQMKTYSATEKRQPMQD
jgi:hypothetical protein